MNDAFITTHASASSLAERVDQLFYALVWASAVVVVILVALNLTLLIKYRQGSRADRSSAAVSTWKVEASWIAGILAGFLVFFFWGARLFLDMERAPEKGRQVVVIGRQWMWDVRQPDGRREFNELHVPVGEPVRLVMSSEDVIHSFFVPAFRTKQDVVPGKVVSLWFEATRPGNYRIFCSQYCGTEHAQMVGQVVAQTPEDYARWSAEGNIVPGAGSRGRTLFVRYGCSGCHTAGSSTHAPLLNGLYGKQVALADGSFVKVDDQYLVDSILEPTKQIAAGYAPVMPSFKGVVAPGDLIDLVTYLKTLPDPSAEGVNPP